MIDNSVTSSAGALQAAALEPATGLQVPSPASTSSLPSVGVAGNHAWAKSWADLSQQIKAVNRGALRIGETLGQHNPMVDPLTAMRLEMGEIMKFGYQMHQASVQVTVLTGVVQNTSSAVHKLLTQQ